MMMPGLSLSAEINIKTGYLFGKNSSPFQNSPFAGNAPKNIERNLFSPKRIIIQNGNQYDFNHNNRQSNKAIYNPNSTNAADAAMLGGTTGGGTTLRRYNTPLNSEEVNVVAAYNMTSIINMASEAGEPSSEEGTTTPPWNNNYSGSGAPSEYNAPIGDAMWPLILFALTYIVTKRRSKN